MMVVIFSFVFQIWGEACTLLYGLFEARHSIYQGGPKYRERKRLVSWASAVCMLPLISYAGAGAGF